MSMEVDTQRQPEILDSLPYYDNDLEVIPALKQKVDAELARESRNTPQALHPKVPPPIDLFPVSDTLCVVFRVILIESSEQPLTTS